MKLQNVLNVPSWVPDGHDIALVAGNGNSEVSTLSITFLLTIVVAFRFAMHRAMAETNRQPKVIPNSHHCQPGVRRDNMFCTNAPSKRPAPGYVS